MKHGKALCRILAVLLICALVTGFAPVVESPSAQVQAVSAGASDAAPLETVTDDQPAGQDDDPADPADPVSPTTTPTQTPSTDPTPGPSTSPDQGEAKAPHIDAATVSDEQNEWAKSRTVTVATSGSVDRVEYRLAGAEDWSRADGEDGHYTFVLKADSAEPTVYEVRACSGEQVSDSVSVNVGKIDATAPKVEVERTESSLIKNKFKVTLSDALSGLNKDKIQIKAFYSTDNETKTYIDDGGLNRALKNAKNNYKGGEFVVTFELDTNKTVVGRFDFKSYAIDIEVVAVDNAGNIEVVAVDNAGNELVDGATPGQLGGPISCKVERSIWDENKKRYRVGEDSELTVLDVGKGKTVTVDVVDVDGKPVGKEEYAADGNGNVVIRLVDILAKDGSYTIHVDVAGKGTVKLDVDYVSGKPAISNVEFESQNAIQKFLHAITGGLMFAETNTLTITPIKPEAGDTAGKKTAGAAYCWQSEATEQPKKPNLVDNGKGGVELNDSSWKQAQNMIIPCPKESFSGYLYVAVWNEVGTCSEIYTYKYDKYDSTDTRLTNLGVAYGENNGVVVFVTTPTNDGEDEKEYKEYVAQNPDGTENWVQQVNFDVQWDKNELKNWLKEWASNQTEYQDTENVTYKWDSLAYDETRGIGVAVTAQTNDGSTGEDEDIVDGIQVTDESYVRKFFTIGGAVGPNGENKISRNTPVQFIVTVSANVTKETTTKNDDGTTASPTSEVVKINKSFKIDKIPLYVQNYLNAPTVTAEANVGTDKPKTLTNHEVEEKWYNGNNNILQSLVITESGKSNAPYTLSYTLTKPGRSESEPAVEGEKSSDLFVYKHNDNVDNVDNFSEDGVYTLKVDATDAAGNKAKTASYTIKYDVNAPDVTAVFTQKTKNVPYYAMQRAINITVKDDMFVKAEPTFEQDQKGNLLKGIMTTDNNVSIETEIAYTHGSAPQFEGKWDFDATPDDGHPAWKGTYTYGTADGSSSRDGDNYTLRIKATDEAGNVTETTADGDCTKNGKAASNCYTVEDENSTDFTIDQTMPQVSVRFDNNSVVNGKYFPAGRTATITVVEHNFDPTRVDLTADGNSGITRWQDDGDTHTATVSFRRDAACKFAIQVMDKAGNICKNNQVDYGGSVAHDEFVIDTTAPTLTLTGVNGPFADACTPGFDGQDENMSAEYELHLMRSVRENAADDASALCSRDLVHAGDKSISAVFSDIPDMLENGLYYSDGIYKMSVTIRDMAGNSTTQEATFAVNRHGSFYVYGEALANLVAKQFAQSDFVDEQTGAWTIQEYNASPVEPDSVQVQVYRDNALVTSFAPEIAGGLDSETGLYRYVYELDRSAFAQDGLYKVQVRSKDEAGNLSENIDEVDDDGNVTTPEKYQCTLSFVIDNVDPEFTKISGLEKRRYREASHEVDFAVADTYGLARVSVMSGDQVVAEYLSQAEVDALGGADKLAANQKLMPDELTLESVAGDVMLQQSKSAQTITFVAVDKAGNTYTTGSTDQKPLGFHQKVTISTNGFVLYIHNAWAVILTVVALCAIAGGIWYFVSKKKKHQGAAN